MRLLAGVTDTGINFEVVSVFQGEETAVFEFDGSYIYEIPSIDCFTDIQDALENGKTVHFPKNLENPLTSSDLIIQDIVDDLVAAKATTRTEIKQFVSNRIGSLSMFEFYGFSLSNNKLMSEGYIINEENIDAKEIEINATDDDLLKNALVKYKLFKDRLDVSYALYIEYILVYDLISNATTLEELQTVKDNFYNNYS